MLILTLLHTVLCSAPVLTVFSPLEGDVYSAENDVEIAVEIDQSALGGGQLPNLLVKLNGFQV